MAGHIRVAMTLEQCWHEVPGGTATAALELARALVARDDVTVVGVSARHREPPPAPWVPPVPVEMLPLPRLALYEAWHALRWPRVEMATGTVDVVHATAMAVPGCRAPLVVTIHDLAFLRYPEHATRHGHRFFRRALELIVRHANLVLCSSEATASDCQAAGIGAQRLRVVPLGAAGVRAGAAEVAEVRARLDLPERFCLFVGTVEPRKNLPRLLEAYAGLEAASEVPLVVAGPAGWNEDIEPALAALGDRVRRVGFVDAATLRALYAGASVFCYPSLFEGFGLPVLEAMAQATPVVTSAGTACAEVAGDAALLVDPLDAGAIREALAGLLADPAAAEALGRRGQDRSTSYTWEATARSTLEAYREVAA